MKRLTDLADVMDLRVIVAYYKKEYIVLFDKAALLVNGERASARGTGATMEAAAKAYIARIRGKELAVGTPPTLTSVHVPGGI